MSTHYIDLRSDTVTTPCTPMREAMAKAPVGDDVYREDPTVNRLEAMAADITGKESALFVPSGSMGNLIALYILAGRESEVLAHSTSHIIQHEVGAISTIAGAMPIGISSPRGLLRKEDIAPHIKPKAYDLAKSALIEIENTIGGICYPLELLQEIYAFAQEQQIPVHLDGARLFNAAIATGVCVKEIVSYTDSVTFCVSKGLGAPVGSLLCGTKEYIEQARRVRKLLGGGMRQAGILAAAAIYALEHHVDRLQEDHLHAQSIALALSESEWATVTIEDVQTNIIFFSTEPFSAQQVVETLKKRNILCSGHGNIVRMVTHLDLSPTDIEIACNTIRQVSASDIQQQRVMT